MISGSRYHAIPILGPGYAVTLGYIVRVFMPAHLSGDAVVGAKRIWRFSALVQGAWLGFWLCAVLFNPFDRTIWSLLGLVVTLWWSFAFAASVYAVYAEGRSTELAEDNTTHSSPRKGTID